jgi:2,4-dienoyl-CoA reductase-like NADH-dependent reductase (Old Yellow Enzyme family)
MREIFDTTEINGMKLKNRLVRSATWEGMCESDGRPTEKLISYYKDLARGGVGLIITGYAFVRPEGKQLPGKMGIHTDNFSDEMKKMSSAVHDEGGRICIQLVHAGGQTNTDTAGRQPLAPSAVKVDQFDELPAEATKEEIQEIIEAFGEGARRAKEYGFDAVQLHGAHGYLINQFLSPLTNQRSDEYGGSVENRCRFLMEVYEKVRSVVGKEFPVLIKLNGSDNLEGGIEIGDAVVAAKLLDKAGIDAIEVSCGTPASGDRTPARIKIKDPSREAYNLPAARDIKQSVSCPVMSVGGYRSYDVVQNVIRDDVDYVSLARPLIREQDLPLRWQNGDVSTAKCISCNSCFRPGIKEGGIYCVVEKKEREKVQSG